MTLCTFKINDEDVPTNNAHYNYLCVCAKRLSHQRKIIIYMKKGRIQRYFVAISSWRRDVIRSEKAHALKP